MRSWCSLDARGSRWCHKMIGFRVYKGRVSFQIVLANWPIEALLVKGVSQNQIVQLVLNGTTTIVLAVQRSLHVKSQPTLNSAWAYASPDLSTVWPEAQATSHTTLNTGRQNCQYNVCKWSHCCNKQLAAIYMHQVEERMIGFVWLCSGQLSLYGAECTIKTVRVIPSRYTVMT